MGDILRMNSFTDENVVAHYVFNSPANGPFVTVYRGPWSDEVDSLDGYQHLFGPICCGILPPLRTGEWTITGRVAGEMDRLPMFLMAGIGKPPDQPPIWWLFDGEGERPVGHDIPSDLHDMELLVVWSAVLVEERIREGVNHWSYESTMKHYRKGSR